jgi:lysophospholipase L1-like esterase
MVVRILGVLLAIVVAATAAGLAAAGELAAWGPRAGYFLWLLVLLVLVVFLARWPKVGVPLLVLAALDFTWGIGSWALAPAGSPSLLPPVAAETQRFKWHPLLQAVPIPGLAVTSATGLAIRHSSEGTRGRDPAPADLASGKIVATFGGSATYDIGNGEGETWPDRLAEALKGDRLVVINHGVPGYTSAEHLIQTAFYADRFGRTPRCAVYFVGWNDLRNAHIPGLDPAYADFHLPSQVDSLTVRRIGGSHVTFSPLITVLARLVGAETDTVRYAKDPYALAPADGPDPALAATFMRNVRAISAINRQRGTATVWVGQIVNRERLKGEGLYGWLPRVRDRDVWPMLQELNLKLERTARELGDIYVAIPIDAFGNADFVDQGHFSAAGARRFAQYLAPAVRDACR